MWNEWEIKEGDRGQTGDGKGTYFIQWERPELPEWKISGRRGKVEMRVAGEARP